VIALHEIHDGDRVEIRDLGGNRAQGLVKITHSHARVRLNVLAFGVVIPFAEHYAGGWRKTGKLEVLAHQPPLDLGSPE
jgi:hypothetical protein